MRGLGVAEATVHAGCSTARAVIVIPVAGVCVHAWPVRTHRYLGPGFGGIANQADLIVLPLTAFTLNSEFDLVSGGYAYVLTPFPLCAALTCPNCNNVCDAAWPRRHTHTATFPG